MARLVSLLAIICLCWAVVGVHAIDNSPCCPSCAFDQYDCFIGPHTYASFNHSKHCIENCWGHCLKEPTGSLWSCGREPCGPNPCGFSESASVGTCKPATAWWTQLNKTAGWEGAYDTVMNMTTVLRESIHYAGPLSNTAGRFLRAAGSSMTWLEQHDQSYYTLSVSNASGHFEFDWVVGFAGSGHAMYSVSDEAALIVSEHGPTTMWVAYELEADARIISSQSAIPWGGYFNYPALWPQLLGGTGIVVSPDGAGDNSPALFYWNIYDNATINQVNISVGDCSPSSSVKTSVVSQWRVMCPEELEYKPLSHKPGDLSECRLYFGAEGSGPGGQYLCVMDIDSGNVKSLSPSPTYVNAASQYLQWHPYGALYTADITHDLGPVGGQDIMVFEFSTQTFRWIDNEIEKDVDYQIAPAYPGYHEVSPPATGQSYSMFQDVVVYQNSISFGASGWYVYNLTSKQVYPLAQPYGIPNDMCNRYCYGGNCNVCESMATVGWDSAYAMTNGTIILHRAYSPSSGQQQFGLSRVESSFVLESQKCADGCSQFGGTCANGVCVCFMGCSGVDCATGPDYCRPTHHTGGNDDDDDD